MNMKNKRPEEKIKEEGKKILVKLKTWKKKTKKIKNKQCKKRKKNESESTI